MHFNFDFSARQILWTLTFAAQLVLLVVLLGRDRARRYPWFTVAVALSAMRLMAEVLLMGRIATVSLQEILMTLGDLGVIAGLLVVVEVARRAFAGAQRVQWIVNGAGLVLVALGVLLVWGPWPAAKELALDSLLGRLRLMQLAGQKGSLLVYLLTVQLGLMVVFFGRKYKAGWRSHTQMIAIGLSSAAIASLAMQAVVQSILAVAQPHDHAEYERILALLGKVVNADSVVYVAALVWWIAWLWLDEPGAAQPAPETADAMATDKTADG